MEIAGAHSPEDFLSVFLATPVGEQTDRLLSELAGDDPGGVLATALLAQAGDNWRRYWSAVQVVEAVVDLPDELLTAETRSRYCRLLMGLKPPLPTTDELREEFFLTQANTPSWRALLTQLMRWDTQGTVVTQLIQEWQADTVGRYWTNLQVLRDAVAACDAQINPGVWRTAANFVEHAESEPSNMIDALPAELFAHVVGQLDVPAQEQLGAASHALRTRVGETRKLPSEAKKLRDYRDALEKAERAERDRLSAAQRQWDQQCLTAISHHVTAYETAVSSAKAAAETLYDIKVVPTSGPSPENKLTKVAALVSKQFRQYRADRIEVTKERKKLLSAAKRRISPMVDSIEVMQKLSLLQDQLHGSHERHALIMAEQWSRVLKAARGAFSKLPETRYEDDFDRVEVAVKQLFERLQEVQQAYSREWNLRAQGGA